MVNLEPVFLLAPVHFKSTSSFDISVVSVLCMRGTAYFFMLALTVTPHGPLRLRFKLSDKSRGSLTNTMSRPIIPPRTEMV